MDNEDDVLARIRRVSAELSREALAINRPFLATLLEMAMVEAQLDAARQTSPGQSQPGDDGMHPQNPSDAPDTGT